MKYWKKEQAAKNDYIVDSAEYINIGLLGNETIDISNYDYKLFRIRHIADTAGTSIPFLYLHKGESVIIGPSGKRLQVTVNNDSIVVERLDNAYGAYVDGYKVVYIDYPEEEITAETANTLYTLDAAANVIAEEVKASE